MLPVNEIGAGGVRPIHISPHRGLRVVLMKHVIAATEIDRTIGIVHPVVRGKQMILGAKGIAGQLFAERGGVVVG